MVGLVVYLILSVGMKVHSVELSDCHLILGALVPHSLDGRLPSEEVLIFDFLVAL